MKARLACAALLGLAVCFAPRVVDGGVLRLAGELLLAVCMAQMWNLMAGYSGLLSLGHQLFVGIGAYTLFAVSQHFGLAPCVALPLAGLAGGAAAALLAPALFRLREAYFSIGLWVFAEIAALVVSKSTPLGSATGLALDISTVDDVEAFQAVNFWIAAAIGLGSLVGVYGVISVSVQRLGLRIAGIPEAVSRLEHDRRVR